MLENLETGETRNRSTETRNNLGLNVDSIIPLFDVLLSDILSYKLGIQTFLSLRLNLADFELAVFRCVEGKRNASVYRCETRRRLRRRPFCLANFSQTFFPIVMRFDCLPQVIVFFMQTVPCVYLFHHPGRDGIEQAIF